MNGVLRKLKQVKAALLIADRFPAKMAIVIHDSIMLSENLPSYTGTYAGAIRQEISEAGEEVTYGRVYMSVESLLESAAEHAQEIDHGGDSAEVGGGSFGFEPDEYVFGKAQPEKADPGDWQIIGRTARTYAERLEMIGSPSYDTGRGIWHKADVDARRLYRTTITEIKRKMGAVKGTP